MSRKYSKLLFLSINPSHLPTALFLGTYLATAGLLIFLPLSGWWRGAVVLLLGWAAVCEWRSTHAPGRVIGLRLTAPGHCRYRTGVGPWHEVVVCGAFVQTWLVILQLRAPGRRAALQLFIPRFVLSPCCFRRLRARLRHYDWEA